MSDGVVIFGLDGVLADQSRRRPTGKETHWRQRWPQDVLAEEKPIQYMAKLARQLSEENRIIIVSERPMAIMEVSNEWLRSKCGITPETIIMQQTLDMRPSAESKIEAIQEALGLYGSDAWLLVDNDPEVVHKFTSMQGLLVG